MFFIREVLPYNIVPILLQFRHDFSEGRVLVSAFNLQLSVGMQTSFRLLWFNGYVNTVVGKQDRSWQTNIFQFNSVLKMGYGNTDRGNSFNAQTLNKHTMEMYLRLDIKHLT